VKDLFVAALELADPQARRALLERACADDPDLRRRLDVLLAAHDHPESALERPLAGPERPTNPVVTAAHTPSAETVGAVVAGRYKLLEAIGEGGMGQVWVADQLDPIRRRVALKVIKPGMDSRPILARFEAERQALAMMNHPNIAKALDAGTTDDGRPFFVMDLVKGTPITEFCDARRLTPRERLELFIPVCQAIQHAHQKGVIHRDIKPTNVLVELYDDRAVPKVIDFGIAKAVGQRLTEKTLYTGFGTLVGTPAYMAPEQATFNALDVDTRADVYALGVLLYELLAGSPPFEPERLRRAALDEVLRLVREEEPPRPSARLSTSQAKASIAAVRQSDPAKLAKLMRGELDWVVMKAMEKDRARRYDTAAGLARDVERYLKDEAVEACPPSLGYRLLKFYHRNRAAIIAVALVAFTLKITTAFSMWQARLATAAEKVAAWQRDRANRQRDGAVKARDAAVKAEAAAARQRDETNAALGKLRLAQEQQQANQYVWDMQLLPLAFEANNVAEVNRVLDRHVPPPGQPDRRGFEWYYWDRQLHTDLRTDRLPDAASKGPAVWAASPDGSKIGRFSVPVSASAPPDDAPVLTVWDAATRTVLLRHAMPIKKPMGQSYNSTTPKYPLFSRDGRRVAVEWSYTTPTLPDGRHLRQVLEVPSGKVLLGLEGNLATVGLSSSRDQVDGAFSPDGRRFAAGCRGPATGVPPNAPPRAVLPAHVRAWELDAGQELGTPIDGTLADPPFGPDGAVLLTRKRHPQFTRVSVWDVEGGRERVGWDVSGPPLTSLALSPDGSQVAGITPDRSPAPKVLNSGPELLSIRAWETATGKEVLTLPLAGRDRPGPSPDLNQGERVFYSPDGSRLAVERYSASLSGWVSDFAAWNARTGTPLPAPDGQASGGAARRVGGTTFSPDGKQIVRADGTALRTWDVETGKPVLTLRGHLNVIAAHAFFPDGKRLWSLEAGGHLKEWDARPPGPLAVPFAAPARTVQTSRMAALSADGSRVAAVIEVRREDQSSPAVRVWDTTGKTVKTLLPPPREPGPSRGLLPYFDLALSRDGRRALLARADQAPFDWKGEAATPPPDLTVWDVESGAVLLHQVVNGRHQAIASISPDGRTAAVATGPTTGTAPPPIRLFDVDARRELAPIAVKETMVVLGLSFSPDGRRLLGSVVNVNLTAPQPFQRQPFQRRLVVWDVTSSSQLCTVDVGADGPSVVATAWAPDGARFAVAHGRGDDTAVEVHDAATGGSLLTLDQPLAGGAGRSPPHGLVYSPDGRRIAGYFAPRALGAPPVLKVWDAASGKELLTARPPASESTGGTRQLTFGGDGRRLILAELPTDRRPREVGGGETTSRALLLTTWDATPLPGREPKKP
jgi:WD40 repeat protein